MVNKKETKAWKILEFIGSSKEGKTLKEIQHYIFVTLIGHSEEEFNKTTPRKRWLPNGEVKVTHQRDTRGFYCTNLYGCWGSEAGQGLFKPYCKKVNKKWVLVKMPSEGENIYKPYETKRYGWHQ